jgi:hypothetical protein
MGETISNTTRITNNTHSIKSQQERISAIACLLSLSRKALVEKFFRNISPLFTEGIFCDRKEVNIYE